MKAGENLKVVYYRDIKKVYDENSILISRDCSKCKRHLEANSFPQTKGASYIDGIKGKCKDCTKGYFDEYAATNHEVLKNYRQSYYVENKEEIDRKNKEYHEKNKEAMAEYHRRWRTENKDHLKAYHEAWSNENRDSLNEYKSLFTSNRRTIMKKLPSDLTAEEWISIKSRFDFKCALSNSEETTLEHFIPSSIGHGGTTIHNCYPLDSSLNYSKNNKNPFKWVKVQIENGNINIHKWNELVAYLANMNGLSASDYKEFVDWCFKNKRKSSEILDDTSSLDLWLKERG